MITPQPPTNPAFFLGIDVGKKDLFCSLITPKITHSECFDNTQKGITSLLKWAESFSSTEPLYICLEHTGCYGKPVAKAFLEGGFKNIYVVNPQRIKAYAQRKLRRNKSDSADARLIAQFIRAEHHELRTWVPQSPDHELITELSRYADSLTQDSARLKTKCEAVSNSVILRSLKRRITLQEKEVKDFRKRINTIIKKNNALSVQKKLLESIPGIGEVSSHTLIAELPDIEEFQNARQLAAWSGLTPRHYESGTSGRSRTPITKVGSTYLRRNLFMPAMSARICNPLLKEFGDRLKENGKTPKQVIVAIMRKLLHLVYGILKSGEPFNPEKRGYQTVT